MFLNVLFCSDKVLKNINKYHISVRLKSYSKTVLLPKTKFPLKLENDKLVERDASINKIVSQSEFYIWQRNNLKGEEFILHDGPPYANGSPHMGHAINKILKDTILRHKVLNGRRVHYVPGWDCHGLPIELKALSNSENLPPAKIRHKAREFATRTVDKQIEVFKSWGILGDWTNAYKTMSVSYVKNQLKQFLELYNKKYIYRDFKPIYWSPSTRTALAEAELEYNENHISPSAYIRLKIKDINVESLKDKLVYALVWTTTPWTLPSNQIVAFNPDITYCFVRKPEEKIIYIVAVELVENLSKEFNVNLEILGVLSGDLLENTTYYHPVYKEKICRFLPSSHTTATKGTGLVHTAPAHGPEDFLVALDNRLDIVDLVDDKGCYKDIAGDKLAKKFVLDEGNETVLNLIKDDVFHVGQYKHSYPYDWRTKKPVIIKASQQWFIDTNAIKDKAADLLKDVNIIPRSNSEIYKRNLLSHLEKRPYWCISRQRKWGVPIPVLYDLSNNNTIINETTILHFCDLLDKHGTDFWWSLPLDKLIPADMMQVNTDKIRKGEDILDIWFDSGISWSYVFGNEKIADLYLEGADQFTGWFQSSLLTSVALKDKSPYKSIYIHGFAVDENGMKMSKSLGNVIDPLVIMKGGKGKKPYGVDVLRWWVACHANQDPIVSVSANVLESCATEVQKIRSVLRFALGAIFDYTSSQIIQYNDLLLIDKYMLHLLLVFHKQVQNAYEEYQFNKINSLTLNLLTNPVSALYYTSIKDRLYCDLVDSSSRLAVQYVLLNIFRVVTNSVAPIVPHLAEELHSYLPKRDAETFFTCKHHPPQTEWENYSIENVMDQIIAIKKNVNKEVGVDTLSCSVELSLSLDMEETIKEILPLSQLQDELDDILQVAEVRINKEPIMSQDFKVNVTKSKKYLCGRCRKFQSENESNLCGRCNDVVNDLSNKEALVSYIVVLIFRVIISALYVIASRFENYLTCYTMMLQGKQFPYYIPLK